MAKLSEAQVKALRAAREAGASGVEIKGRTRTALSGMFAIVPTVHGNGTYSITPTGGTYLDEHERAEKAKQEQAERASRPVPASAFVEPSARTAPVMGLEYEDEQDEEPMCREGDDEPHPIGSPECILTQLAETERPESGPTVQLTPRPEDVEQEATDAEILQLLTMLDHGASVHRGLYQEYGVLDAGPFRLNLDAVNRAARDAVRFGLARQTYSDRLYRLEVEPIHLLTGDGQVTPCGRYPVAARNSGKRLRVTADPAKVTHDFCQK